MTEEQTASGRVATPTPDPDTEAADMIAAGPGHAPPEPVPVTLPGENVFAATLDELRNLYGQVVALIQRDPQAQRAFEVATALADTLRQLAQQAADVRAQAAARIAKEEKLSLSVLATRIGVSKARAGQLVKSIEGTGIDLETTEGE